MDRSLLFAVAGTLALGGCASSIPPPPKVVYIPVESKVAKTVVPARPTLPIDLLSPGERDPAKVIKAYAGSVCALIGYVNKLVLTFAPYELTVPAAARVQNPCG